MLFCIKSRPSMAVFVGVIGVALSLITPPVFAQSAGESWQSPEDISYLNELESMAVSMELENLAVESAITLFAAPSRSDLVTAAMEGDIAACYELAALSEAAPLPSGTISDTSQMSDDYLAALSSCYVETLGQVVE